MFLLCTQELQGTDITQNRWQELSKMDEVLGKRIVTTVKSSHDYV